MPEVLLCKRCKQPLNKQTDEYVVIGKETDRRPEMLAHVTCEQKGFNTFGFDDWVRKFRWPNRV